MNDLPESLTADISLWLAGESVGAEADRAVEGLAHDASARRTAGTALATEDLVRDWYGAIPLPSPEPHVIERQERRSLASAAISAAAVGTITATLLASVPVSRVLEAAGGWTIGGLRPAVATSSWWQLRQGVPPERWVDAGLVRDGIPDRR